MRCKCIRVPQGDISKSKASHDMRAFSTVSLRMLKTLSLYSYLFLKSTIIIVVDWLSLKFFYQWHIISMFDKYLMPPLKMCGYNNILPILLSHFVIASGILFINLYLLLCDTQSCWPAVFWPSWCERGWQDNHIQDVDRRHWTNIWWCLPKPIQVTSFTVCNKRMTKIL